MRAIALASLLWAFTACNKPQPTSGVVQSATRPNTIPRPPVTTPPRGAALPGKNLGKPGSASVGWSFAGAPHDGVDALRVTMSPELTENGPKNFIYWAFQGAFLDNSAFYVGLQPNGEFGKTALFSVFGKGTTPKVASCQSGADGGAGTHCHIHYDWAFGHAYEFIVTLAAIDGDEMTWEGVVADLGTGAVTPIGSFSVEAARGLLKATGVNFAEFFKRPTPCPDQAKSEVLFHQPFVYRSGREFAGTISSLNQNSGCDSAFFGDGKTSVFVDVGQ